jgi:hypothetical protein
MDHCLFRRLKRVTFAAESNSSCPATRQLFFARLSLRDRNVTWQKWGLDFDD